MFNRGRNQDDFSEEIKAHLELEADQLRSEGLSDKEAYRKARVSFGSAIVAEERFHLRHRVIWFDNLLRDVRFAVRQLGRNPGFTAVILFTLSLGIGASTSIFSVADAVLLRPLPYPHPQQVVRVWEQKPNGHRINFAESNFDDFAAQNRSFVNMAAYEYGLASVSGGSEPARVNVASVSRGFFATLGTSPLRGRLFAPEEQSPHGAPAIVVSYGFWQRYLGSTADLSKLQLELDGGVFPVGVYPVVGVMPPEFNYPAGTSAWIPRELDPPSPSRTAHNWRVIGRVRDDFTLAQARENLNAIAQRIRSQYGTKVDLNSAALVTLSNSIVGDVRSALLSLLGAVGLFLLVACANVAGLLVARTSARSKELAIRAILGAGRGRLIQQLLAESFVLSLLAGVAGILMAAALSRILPAILPADLPRKEAIALNPQVLVFAIIMTLFVGGALGILAAWRAGGGGLHDALGSGIRVQTGSTASQRLRRILVIGEIAATLVMLTGAGLLGRSFLRLISTSPGFRPENLITMEFSPPVPPGGMDDAATVRQIHLLDDITLRLRAIPGVVSVGTAGAIPVAAGDNLPDGDFLVLDGRKPPATFEEFGELAQNRAQTGHALYAVASQGYFHTLGIPLLRGRVFGDQDSVDSPHVALISETLARLRWPGQNPVGQIIDFGNMDGNLKPLTIVGVVGDTRVRGLDAPPDSVIYVDYRQRGIAQNSTPTILMRIGLPKQEIIPQARAVFHHLAPAIPVRFSTFSAAMGGWLAERRFLLLLVGLFAAAALLLASVGLYGVVSFFVIQRTQEIGVRMAMGAQRIDVLYLVLSEAAQMTGLGLLVGIVASLALTRLVSNLVFGITTSDPVTFAAVAVLMSLVALFASCVPVWHAMRIDPMTALRHE